MTGQPTGRGVGDTSPAPRPFENLPAVEPYPDHDPVAYEEMTREQLAWRSTMHLLADTGGAVLIPAHLPPPHEVDLAFAAGWLYRVGVERVPGGGVLLTCRHSGWQPPTGVGSAG